MGRGGPEFDEDVEAAIRALWEKTAAAREATDMGMEAAAEDDEAMEELVELLESHPEVLEAVLAEAEGKTAEERATKRLYDQGIAWKRNVAAKVNRHARESYNTECAATTAPAPKINASSRRAIARLEKDGMWPDFVERMTLHAQVMQERRTRTAAWREMHGRLADVHSHQPQITRHASHKERPGDPVDRLYHSRGDAAVKAARLYPYGDPATSWSYQELYAYSRDNPDRLELVRRCLPGGFLSPASRELSEQRVKKSGMSHWERLTAQPGLAPAALFTSMSEDGGGKAEKPRGRSSGPRATQALWERLATPIQPPQAPSLGSGIPVINKTTSSTDNTRLANRVAQPVHERLYKDHSAAKQYRAALRDATEAKRAMVYTDAQARLRNRSLPPGVAAVTSPMATQGDDQNDVYARGKEWSKRKHEKTEERREELDTKTMSMHTFSPKLNDPEAHVRSLSPPRYPSPDFDSGKRFSLGGAPGSFATKKLASPTSSPPKSFGQGVSPKRPKGNTKPAASCPSAPGTDGPGCDTELIDASYHLNLSMPSDLDEEEVVEFGRTCVTVSDSEALVTRTHTPRSLASGPRLSPARRASDAGVEVPAGSNTITLSGVKGTGEGKQRQTSATGIARTHTWTPQQNQQTPESQKKLRIPKAQSVAVPARHPWQGEVANAVANQVRGPPPPAETAPAAPATTPAGTPLPTPAATPAASAMTQPEAHPSSLKLEAVQPSAFTSTPGAGLPQRHADTQTSFMSRPPVELEGRAAEEVALARHASTAKPPPPPPPPQPAVHLSPQEAMLAEAQHKPPPRPELYEQEGSMQQLQAAGEKPPPAPAGAEPAPVVLMEKEQAILCAASPQPPEPPARVPSVVELQSSENTFVQAQTVEAGQAAPPPGLTERECYFLKRLTERFENLGIGETPPASAQGAAQAQPEPQLQPQSQSEPQLRAPPTAPSRTTSSLSAAAAPPPASHSSSTRRASTRSLTTEVTVTEGTVRRGGVSVSSETQTQLAGADESRKTLPAMPTPPVSMPRGGSVAEEEADEEAAPLQFYDFNQLAGSVDEVLAKTLRETGRAVQFDAEKVGRAKAVASTILSSLEEQQQRTAAPPRRHPAHQSSPECFNADYIEAAPSPGASPVLRVDSVVAAPHRAAVRTPLQGGGTSMQVSSPSPTVTVEVVDGEMDDEGYEHEGLAVDQVVHTVPRGGARPLGGYRRPDHTGLTASARTPSAKERYHASVAGAVAAAAERLHPRPTTLDLTTAMYAPGHAAPSKPTTSPTPQRRSVRTRTPPAVPASPPGATPGPFVTVTTATPGGASMQTVQLSTRSELPSTPMRHLLQATPPRERVVTRSPPARRSTSKGQQEQQQEQQRRQQQQQRRRVVTPAVGTPPKQQKQTPQAVGPGKALPRRTAAPATPTALADEYVPSPATGGRGKRAAQAVAARRSGGRGASPLRRHRDESPVDEYYVGTDGVVRLLQMGQQGTRRTHPSPRGRLSNQMHPAQAQPRIDYSRRREGEVAFEMSGAPPLTSLDERQTTSPERERVERMVPHSAVVRSILDAGLAPPDVIPPQQIAPPTSKQRFQSYPAVDYTEGDAPYHHAHRVRGGRGARPAADRPKFKHLEADSDDADVSRDTDGPTDSAAEEVTRALRAVEAGRHVYDSRGSRVSGAPRPAASPPPTSLRTPKKEKKQGKGDVHGAKVGRGNVALADDLMACDTDGASTHPGTPVMAPGQTPQLHDPLTAYHLTPDREQAVRATSATAHALGAYIKTTATSPDARSQHQLSLGAAQPAWDTSTTPAVAAATQASLVSLLEQERPAGAAHRDGAPFVVRSGSPPRP